MKCEAPKARSFSADLWVFEDMVRKLTEREWEDLSTFHDGELSASRRAEVAELIRSDDAWCEAARQMETLDEILSLRQSPPVPSDLSQRICKRSHQIAFSSPAVKALRWAVPLATAAAVLLLVWIVARPVNQGEQMGQQVQKILQQDEKMSADENKALEGLNKHDRFVVQNLDFFADYNVIEHFETLEAIDRLENQQGT